MSQLQPVTHFPLPKNEKYDYINMKKEREKKNK